MKKGKPRYRIVCDAKGFNEPLVVGGHSYFGYYLVDSFEDELKITKDDVYSTGSDCLKIMRLLRDVKDSLEGADDNAYTNFRVAKIWYDRSTNTQIFEDVDLEETLEEDLER